MQIETQNGTMVDSDNVRYYRYTSDNGTDDMVGSNKDWHLTAFLNDKSFVSLASFKRPNYILKKDYGRSEAYKQLKYALISGDEYISFKDTNYDHRDDEWETSKRRLG